VNRTEKEANVAELRDAWLKASALYLADYRGLSVPQVEELRNKCREVGVHYRVVKNTLAKRAIEGTEKAVAAGAFKGPVAVAWHDTDAVAPAKVLTEFAKANDKFTLKEAVVEGTAYAPEQVTALAKLPGRDALRSQLLGILMAPLQQIVSVMAAPARDVVGTIDAYAKKLGDGDNA